VDALRLVQAVHGFAGYRWWFRGGREDKVGFTQPVYLHNQWFSKQTIANGRERFVMGKQDCDAFSFLFEHIRLID
jgi:hypothetical protein